MTNPVNLNEVANNGKTLKKFVGVTIANYAKVALSLHQAACMTFFHSAQYGDCDALNMFYRGLRVNDQTALRVWVGNNATFLADDNTVKPWIKWTKETGFAVIKGLEDKRKNLFLVDAIEEGKTTLITLPAFYEKDVKDKDAITLEALIAMLGKAAKRVNDQATKEGLTLPVGVSNLVRTIERETNVEIAALKRVSDKVDAHTVINLIEENKEQFADKAAAVAE